MPAKIAKKSLVSGLSDRYLHALSVGQQTRPLVEYLNCENKGAVIDIIGVKNQKNVILIYIYVKQN